MPLVSDCSSILALCRCRHRHFCHLSTSNFGCLNGQENSWGYYCYVHRLRTNVEDVKAEVLFTYPVVCISYPCTSSSLKVWFLHQDDQPYFSVSVWLGDSGPSLHDNGPHHKHIGWFVRVHKGQSECLLQSNVHDLDRVVRQMPLVACLTRRTHVDGWLCKPCMHY